MSTREARDKATLDMLDRIGVKTNFAASWLADAMEYDRNSIDRGCAGDRQRAERCLAEVRHLAARLAATYGPEPVRVINPADAALDCGDQDPEDDGGPTDDEIDEAARYAAGEKFAADISASAYQRLLGLMRRRRRGA